MLIKQTISPIRLQRNNNIIKMAILKMKLTYIFIVSFLNTVHKEVPRITLFTFFTQFVPSHAIFFISIMIKISFCATDTEIFSHARRYVNLKILTVLFTPYFLLMLIFQYLHSFHVDVHNIGT